MDYFLSGACIFGTIFYLVGIAIGAEKFQSLYNASEFENRSLKEKVNELGNTIKKLKKK